MENLQNGKKTLLCNFAFITCRNFSLCPPTPTGPTGLSICSSLLFLPVYHLSLARLWHMLSRITFTSAVLGLTAASDLLYNQAVKQVNHMLKLVPHGWGSFWSRAQPILKHREHTFWLLWVNRMKCNRRDGTPYTGQSKWGGWLLSTAAADTTQSLWMRETLVDRCWESYDRIIYNLWYISKDTVIK